MYINSTEKSVNLLKVDESFATLTNVIVSPVESSFNIKELHFEFFFRISQINALRNNALSVNITVKKNNQILPSMIEGKGKQRLNSNRIIQNILTNKIKLNNLAKKDSESIVIKKTADITSKVNNHLLNPNLSVQQLESLGLRKPTIILKNNQKLLEESNSDNIKKSLKAYSTLDSTNFTSDDLINQRRRLGLLKQGISPTFITQLPNKVVTPYDSTQGSIKKSGANISKYSDVSKLHDSHLLDASFDNKSNSSYEVVLDSVYNDIVVVKTKLVINGSLIKEPLLLVTFELLQTVFNIDGTKQINILEKVQKNFNVNEHITSYYSSKISPPQVNSFTSDKNITFQVSSGDHYTGPIKIFKRVLDDDLFSSYSEVGIINFSFPRQTINYNLLNPKNEDSIYRFVYSDNSSGLVNTEFSDIIIKNPRKKRSNKIILIPNVLNGGINVEVVNTVLLDVSKVFLLIRNMTTKQKDYTIVSTVDFGGNKTINTVNISKGLIPYHNYELTTKLVFLNGTEELSSYSTYVEYVPYIGDLGSYSITGVSVVGTEVTFTPTFQVQTDQISLLNTLLSKVSSTYNTDSLDTRKNPLDTFIAFQVMRYNLENGDAEYLGIVANNELFTDSTMSSMYFAKPLSSNSSYKYVLYPLVRDPSTVMEENKELRDHETRKFYKSNFRKSRHPLSLIKGISVSKNFIDNDTKNDMLYGKIGTSLEVNVAITSEDCKISNFYASFLDLNKVCLTWNILGDLSEIDHFLVFKESNQTKTLIGKSHCLQSSFSFIYSITKSDIGNVRFSLTPIRRNFSSGKSIISNELLINNQEMIL